MTHGNWYVFMVTGDFEINYEILVIVISTLLATGKGERDTAACWIAYKVIQSYIRGKNFSSKPR
jgi:hypothetical protein